MRKYLASEMAVSSMEKDEANEMQGVWGRGRDQVVRGDFSKITSEQRPEGN